MNWEWIKRTLKGDRPNKKTSKNQPAVKCIDAKDNPWKVPVFDFREVTLSSMSFSTDKQCALNALSYSGDDGLGFVGEPPTKPRLVEANLRFAIDRILADGVLFTPQEMEHKWALFFHKGEIICVRSWLRSVAVVAHVQIDGDLAIVSKIDGSFAGEDAQLTGRLLDFLVRSHALGLAHPVPLPGEFNDDPNRAQSWSASLFGHFAHFGTCHEFKSYPPKKPLRTSSLLHIAVARNDFNQVGQLLSEGIPADLLAADGLSPLHWSVAAKGESMAKLLLDKGADVDIKSEQGATPLMNAVQANSIEKTELFLSHGADPNAHDCRGFTALHRAAELGNMGIVDLLLQYRADPNPEAEGHTPRSLAAARSHDEIARRLSQV